MEESPMQPPPLPVLAAGEFRHVDPNLIWVDRIAAAGRSLVLIGFAFAGMMIVTLNPDIAPGLRRATVIAWGALFPLLGARAWFWPPIRYRHLFYCLKPDCLVIRRGVFWKMETVVPKSRIQHVDIVQGPLQRGYQISDLILHTAGTRYALVPLGGLTQSLAPLLRNDLLDQRDDDHTL
jgi:uncharacterized protein